MSSTLDQTTMCPEVSGAAASTDERTTDVSDAARQAIPRELSVFRLRKRLRSAVRRTPVTWLLVLANVALFAAMAASQQQLFDFGSSTLLTWGGGFAPRVFAPQWWRAASYMFVHGDLPHLAVNLLFLLLLGPFVERLLGSLQFVLVYFFAGIGGGLLFMGTDPQHVVVGASAAVNGVYGALLGCCLRGPRSIPWRAVLRRGGLLLFYTAVALLGEWLDVAARPLGHLGGVAFGLVGGLLFGHQLQPRAARWKPHRMAVATTVCVGLIGLTAWWVHSCIAKALTYYASCAIAKDRERELLGRFDLAMRQWGQGKITSAQLKVVLERELVPAWQDVRLSYGLKLTGELGDLEQRYFSMQDFWNVQRSPRGVPPSGDAKPLTVQEYGKRYSLLSKIRLDTWRALADDLPGNRLLIVRALMDSRELELLGTALDDEVNVDSPLCRWFGFAGGRHGAARKEKEEPTRQFVRNRSFENGLKGWSALGASRPQFAIDMDVAHEGRQSLRVYAGTPSEAGYAQEVSLTPGRWYRFRGWVRTRGLTPYTATAYGTFRILARFSNDAIAKGDNHSGDTEWTEVVMTFQAPADGHILIMAYLAGFGPGTGTVWFDDLKLVEVDPAER